MRPGKPIKQPVQVGMFVLWPCGCCRKAKHASDYYSDANRLNGLRPTCKHCQKVQMVQTEINRRLHVGLQNDTAA